MGQDGLLQAVKDFFYGFLFHGMVSEVHEKKAEFEDVFMLLIVGETIGVPIPSGFYHLKLIPYYAARFPHWKKKILKPKDLLDIVHD